MKPRKSYKGDIPFRANGDMENYMENYIDNYWTRHKVYLSAVKRTSLGTTYQKSDDSIPFVSPFSEEQLQLEEGDFEEWGRKYPAKIAGVILLPNFEFRTTLEFSDYEKGRSSVQMIFKCPYVRKYSMFLSDFCSIVPHLKDGKLSGNFTFSKKGANYGVVWIGE